ncbi:MAG: hypothetical protein ACRETF_10160 [Nevskiaceae bacterium]
MTKTFLAKHAKIAKEIVAVPWRFFLTLVLATGVAAAQVPDIRQRPGDKEKVEPGETPKAQRAPGRRDEPEPQQLPDPNRRSGLAPVAPPDADPGPASAIPDRWRLLEALDLLPERWYDPYRQNALKGDKPVIGDDGFITLLGISDTVYEPRRLPTPVGPQSTSGAGSTDIFGAGEQWIASQTLLFSFVYLKGNTTFKPPDFEFHLTPAYNFNYVQSQEERLLEVDPRGGKGRGDQHLGLQELFVDFHLRNVSDRYDFDSVRFGIQPFSTDFRGFLFQDNQLMARLFGTRGNNRYQYNVAWIRRLEKDTNSGLNDAGRPLRDDDLYVVNAYMQDFPVLGHTSQAILAHNRNTETEVFFDNNGFLARPLSFGSERPREYEVTYLGYNGDGHFGRLNLTSSLYWALGTETSSPFRDSKGDISAGFTAFEASMDFDWTRWRASLLWASGEDDPFDDEANGFDAVFENPIFAGADTSFWIRQPVPLVGGGVVALSARNGVLNSLRHSKEHGQSNFTNPGVQLAGVGADFDLTPQLRLSLNANQLWFDDTAVLEVARNQGSIDREIGLDLSAALIWRPFMQQNIVLRVSGAMLQPGDGFKDLFPDETPYSVLTNLILTY